MSSIQGFSALNSLALQGLSQQGLASGQAPVTEFGSNEQMISLMNSQAQPTQAQPGVALLETSPFVGGMGSLLSDSNALFGGDSGVSAAGMTATKDGGEECLDPEVYTLHQQIQANATAFTDIANTALGQILPGSLMAQPRFTPTAEAVGAVTGQIGSQIGGAFAAVLGSVPIVGPIVSSHVGVELAAYAATFKEGGRVGMTDLDITNYAVGLQAGGSVGLRDFVVQTVLPEDDVGVLQGINQSFSLALANSGGVTSEAVDAGMRGYFLMVQSANNGVYPDHPLHDIGDTEGDEMQNWASSVNIYATVNDYSPASAWLTVERASIPHDFSEDFMDSLNALKIQDTSGIIWLNGIQSAGLVHQQGNVDAGKVNDAGMRTTLFDMWWWMGPDPFGMPPGERNEDAYVQSASTYLMNSLLGLTFEGLQVDIN